MKKQGKVQIISLIMTLTLIFSLGSMGFASADSTVMPQYQWTDDDGFVWTYYINADNKATIVATTMTSGDVVIPAAVMHEGVSTDVTAINDPTSSQSIFGTTSAGAANTTVTSVMVPAGVTTIGDEAFMNCSALTSVTLPYGVESLGIAVFYKCSSLTSITLPGSISSIDFNTFIFTGIDSMSDITYGNRPGYTWGEWNEAPDGSGDELTTLILATKMHTHYGHQILIP